MSIIGQNILAGASGGGAYTIDQSLRFNTADQPYLTKTGFSGGSTTKGTQSLWFKRGDTGRDQRLLGTWEGSTTTRNQTGWQAADKLYIQHEDTAIRISTQVFRDVSAWYHLVMAWDSTQAAASDRLHVYINGEEITAWDTNTTITQNADIRCNNGEISIGRRVSSAYYWFEGYIAELYWIDGTQYAASDFGETDLLTNQWIPKDASTLTFGTNGFYQKYAGDMGGYTQLLLHCDGANAGTTFTDSSQSGRAVTPDNVTTNTTTKKFGTASAYFPGSGENSLSIPDNAVWDIDFGSSWTWEFWMNAVVPPEDYAGVITHHNAGAYTPGWGIVFNDANYLMLINLAGHTTWAVKSSSVIPNGAWHHYAFVHDDSANTMKLYIDGALDATGSTSAVTLPTSTGPLIIGHHQESNGRQFEGYLDEIRFSTTARYTAAFTVQTEAFGDTSLGADSSGNNNTFTVNNIGITDQLPDSPTNNFATLNPLDNFWFGSTFSEGNLKLAMASTPYAFNTSTIGMSSGKWYWENYFVSNSNAGYVSCGVAYKVAATAADNLGNASSSWGYLGQNGVVYNNGLNARTGWSTYTDGDIVGIALDLDNNNLYFSKNNTWEDSGDPTSGATGTGAISITALSGGGAYYAGLGDQGNTNGPTALINLGQDSSFAGAKTAQNNQDGNSIGDFYYTPPTDYLTLCTSNLPDPSIALPEENYNTVLYDGNGVSGQTISGVGFQPDFSWIKRRNAVVGYALVDALRGSASYRYDLQSESTVAQDTVSTDKVGVLNSDGFTLTGGSSQVNNASGTYVSWNWLAATTFDPADDGTIVTASGRSNAAAGFSIVTYTGNNTSPTTIGHGLSQAPEMIITKRTDSTGTWFVGSDELTAWTYFLELDGSTGQASNAQVYTTAPTASVYSIGNVAAINADTGTFVSYCFHGVDGYSKVGQYRGTGNADGMFVYTGFRPAFVLIKLRPSSGDWHLFDNKRAGYNVNNYDLSPGETAAELTAAKIDLVSNGFKLRASDANINGSTVDYVYYAVAAWPFKTTNGR